MIVSVPDCTWGTLPETGASSMAAPSARTRSASSRLARGLTVLMSTQIFPAARPARIPSGPEATASSTPSSGSEVNTMSAASATSRGVSRHCRPSCTRLVRVLAASLLAVDRVAGGEEAGGHVAAHVPEADEADLRCLSRCHLSPPFDFRPDLDGSTHRTVPTLRRGLCNLRGDSCLRLERAREV